MIRHEIIFLEERKFYASRASNVKLILKLLALDAAKKEGCEYMCLFFPERFLSHSTTEIDIEQPFLYDSVYEHCFIF